MSTQRPPSPLREPPTSGFEVLGNEYRLEEETWSWYNPEEYYPVSIGEVFKDKYQVIGKLGFDSVSTVWLCRNLVEHDYVTLKVFVSGTPQAENEEKIFGHLKSIKSDHPGAKFVRKLRDSFELPGEKGPHVCLVHDALGVTLKQLRELCDGEKLELELVKPIIYHVLFALDYLHSQAKIVHTDVQEENIMMSIANKEILKNFEEEEWSEPSLRTIDGNRVIYASRDLEIPDDFSDFIVCDFGYAVFGEKEYTGEAMPDLYRAPELVLHTPWDEKIDIWSLGLMLNDSHCWTIMEGEHLFKERLPSRNDSTPAHISRMIALLGPPPKDILERGSWSNNFFDESGEFKADVEIATTSLENEMKSSWMCDRNWEGKRVMSFGYDVRRILAGRQTREVIRKLALRLLDELTAERKNDIKRRPIAFLGHDIGGIIVKDVLVAANLHSKIYGDIFDYTRFLIFYGCPHRSDGILDMENRIARFLFGRSMISKFGDAVTMKSTESLAKATMEINGLFLQSKNILRTHAVSIYVDGDGTDVDMDPVFDIFCGTLGAPFERQIKCSGAEHNEIFQNQQKMQLQLAPDSRTFSHERTLLNLASPIFAFFSAHNPDHPFHWITSDETYQSRLDWPDPQLLYIYGRAAQEASEYIFYSLDETRQASEKNEVVVYFTFDAYDVRYGSTNNMLGTFLAQIINHHPSLADWFEYFRIRGQIDGVTCVINHFDDCDEASRRRFIRRFSYISSRQERPWKIVVTSRQPAVLLEELSGWPTIDLDSLLVDAAAITHPDSLRLLQLSPRLGSETDSMDMKIAKFDGADPMVRQVILQQARTRDEWSAYTSSLQFQLGSAEDPSLKSILERILKGAPDPYLAQRILSWAVYSVVPLTIWELGTAILICSTKNRGTEHTASANFIEDIVDKIRTWFAGILRIADNEIMVANVQIRQALLELMKSEEAAMHKIIAETCLNYLQRDSVKAIIEAKYIQPFIQADTDPLSMDAPTFPDRTSFYSYSIKHWADHFAFIAPHLRPRNVLRQFIESKSVDCWSKGHWVLAQPISRSARSQSVYALFTAFGLAEEAESWCNGISDLSLALAEAAMNGFPAEVRKLLSRTEHSESTLQETLVTAGSNGNEDILLYLIKHIEMYCRGFNWPASLLYRAAWLGMDRVVSALLALRMPVHPDDPMQRSTPLHNAARNGHVEVLKVLLRGGADINCLGPYGQTALHTACANGHAEATRVLVEEPGIDLNARDENNFTPLYEASLWGNFKSVEVLVTHGSDTSLGTSIEQDSSGWTPLIVSSEEGYLQCLQFLLDAKADPNLPGPHGTPLHYAVTKGHIDICHSLLKHGADPNHPKLDPPILTQIFINVINTDLRLKMLKLLHQNGAYVNEIDGSGRSSLFHATLLGDISCVEYLLDHGADSELVNAEGRSVFDSAIDGDYVEVVRLLLAKGGDLHTTEYHEQSPLFRAVRKKSEMVRLLLEHGFDPDARSPEGFTPLMLAAGDNYIQKVKLLLQYEATVDLELFHINGSVKSGWTALTFAAERGNSKVVALLIEAGANINHRVDDGSTALHLGFGQGAMHTLMEFRPDISISDNDQNMPLHLIRSWTPLDHIQHLVRAGAWLDTQNKEGYTPLSMALLFSNDAAASYLIERHTNVNLASQIYGAPLHLACRESTVAMARQLVESGADVDLVVPGIPGTPLQSAVLRQGHFDLGSKEIIQYLINEAGADVNRRGGTYGTILAAAVLQGSPSLVSFLLEKKAAPGLADGMGRMPLHMAMLHGLEHVKLIYDAGADVRARDKTGRSVLHWAAQGGSPEVIDYVLKLFRDNEEFDVDERDNDGWTALCWATRGYDSRFRAPIPGAQFEAIKLLLDRGADPGVKARFSNNERRTPSMLAQYNSSPDDVIKPLDTATVKGGGEDSENEAKHKVATSSAKAFFHVGFYCMFCLGEIRGIRYQCKDCVDFNFCYKCNNSRRKLHIEGHFFEGIGPEFAPIYSPSESSSSAEIYHDDSDSDS